MSADIKGGAQTINALTVALDKDISQEEADLLQEMILRMRHVINVTLHEVSISDYVATQRIKADIRDKILEIVL